MCVGCFCEVSLFMQYDIIPAYFPVNGIIPEMFYMVSKRVLKASYGILTKVIVGGHLYTKNDVFQGART